MNTIKKSKFSKVVAGFAIFGMMFAFGGATTAQAALTSDQVNAIVSLLQSFGADAQTVADVRTTLEGGTPTGGTTTGSTGTGYTFATNLSMGDSGIDVMNLQKVLNSNPATQVAASGVGSAGNETTYFGALTKKAVIKFQNLYASEILAPVGLSAGTGYVGPSTRAKLNSISASMGATNGTTTGGSTTGGTVGVGLSISSPAQPANSLAVVNAARVPFTKVTLTNNGSADVVVNSLTVERTGLADNSNFSGVVLLDENGTQIGIAKTLNTNNQATIGEAVTIAPGASRTFTVAANVASSVNSGEIASFAVIAVNTSASVSGSLPITGASHTINGTLSIGSVDPSRGALDPNANQTKEVGTTGYTFTSLKITAGSTEKIRLNSIRFNQSGSAASGDLANVKIVVDGTEYTPVVSADGKYYSAVFGSGIVIDKGMFKEVSIKGDIVSGSGRTIAFDVYKITDINVTGETYGYGITPSTSDSSMSSTSPVYDASVVTVSGGSLTVSKATSVASQNISVNVANQVLGAVKVKVDGEPVSVQSMVFNILATGDEAENITSISLVDANGAVIAGPVDGASNSSNSADGTVTFSDTVTFPVGEGVYTLKGKLGSTFTSNDTVVASTTPSSDWTTVTGQTTGNTITPSPSSAITLQTMTAKSGAVAISVSATPAAQTIVPGVQDFTFANIQFDATASGEDLKFVTMPLSFTNGGTASHITGCQLMSGSTALNSGSNVVDSPSSGSNTFTLDSPFTVAKGSVTTVGLQCDVSGSAVTSDTYAWGIPAASNFSVTGLTSGQTVTATGSADAGQTMTIGAGSFTVTKDASSPSYAIASAGTTGNTLGVLKFSASNEAINLERVALQLTNTASSSASDIAKITLWDGSTKVGEAIFTGSNTNATSTLTGTFQIPKDGSKLMTIKGDFAGIGASLVGTQGALIAVDYDGDDSTGTRGQGAGSGTSINTGSSSDTAMAGVRVFKSFPTVAKISTGIASTLASGEQPLLRFSVTADAAGDVGLDGFSFRMATSSSGSMTVGSINAFAYTDSGFSTPVSGVNASGKLKNSNLTWVDSSTDIEVDIDNAGADTVLQIPAGTTRYFEIRGDVIAASTSGDSVTTTLQGDAAYPSLSTLMGVASDIWSDSNDDFVWSPNATTSSSNSHVDWTNGYGVSGLPSGGLNSQTISR